MVDICFLYLPFGQACSQDVFQNEDASKYWKNMKIVIGIADDITVHGHTEAEHDAHVWKLMEIAQKYALVFNPQENTSQGPNSEILWMPL